MDFDKIRRRQSIRVIISEIIMVLTVIVAVVILAFVVSGYWVNADFEVKRQGLLQVYSVPTGADVDIDGESSWLKKTNTSKTLTSGEHTVTLTKEGYDSWTKVVDIKEGLLYRLHYPRLFLKDRTVEKLFSITGATFASVSSDHTSLILANDTTEWTYINLNEEQISPKKIDISPYFSSVSVASNATTGIFTGEILDVNWDSSSTHALFKIRYSNGIEWVLLNPKEISSSINLTREFGIDFIDLKIFDSNATSLLAIQEDNLRKIDVSGRSISAVLAEGVSDFGYYHNEIVFSAIDNSTLEETYYLGVLKLGDKVTKLKDLEAPSKVAITKFYDEKYIITLTENILTIYQKDDFSLLSSFELGFSPKILEVGREGEFVVAYSGSKIATIDMESFILKEWLAEDDNFGWLDDNMIYSVHDGELTVYDFDGLNRRDLAKNVSHHFPVTITNNRYLYYFSDNYLMREWLIPR